MSENWKIQVSPKLADGTLINLRAENPGEAERILAWATENADLVTKTVAAFGGTVNVTTAFPGSQVIEQTGSPWAAPQQQAPSWSEQGSQQVAPSIAQQGPAPSGRSCVHGQMVYRTGTGKRGPWRAFFCPAPKGDPTQCDAQFIRD